MKSTKSTLVRMLMAFAACGGAIAVMQRLLGPRWKQEIVNNPRYVLELLLQALPHQSVLPRFLLRQLIDLMERYGIDGRDVQGVFSFRSAKPPATEEEVLRMLDAMVGQDAAKSELQRAADFAMWNKQRIERGAKAVPGSRHLVFSGRPGVGKTTFAEFYGHYLRVRGVLPVGHVVVATRANLIGRYIGESEQKFNALWMKANGGVMLLDEAYALTKSAESGDTKDFGLRVVETLVDKLERDREEVVVIACGYEADMAQFLSVNDGLPNRFKRQIRFTDYTSEERMRIFEKFARDNDVRLEPGVDVVAQAAMDACHRRSPDEFGNARGVRTLFETCVECMATRLAPGRFTSVEDQNTVRMDDVLAAERLTLDMSPGRRRAAICA